MINLDTLIRSAGGTEQGPYGLAREYTVVSDPAELQLPDLNDTSALFRRALLSRPEAQAASLSEAMVDTGRALAKAPLYPTVSLSGNYTFANPNSRYLIQSDSEFKGSWNLGISLSCNIGGVPAQLSAVQVQEEELRKAGIQKDRQQELIIQDVRSCLVRCRRAGEDAGLVSRMLEQAQEKERVTRQRVLNGTAADIDLLEDSVSRLKAEYTIVNRQIDMQIAAADLLRALGMAGPGQE